MLSRKFFSHKIWEAARTFSECEAWLDLIQSARFEATDKTERIGGREITYGRGQYPASIRFLAKRWRWGEREVRSFLARLVKERMITTDSGQGMNVITLVKYDEYNGGTTGDTATDTDNAKEIKELKEMVTQLMTRVATQGRHTGDTNSNKGNNIMKEENVRKEESLAPGGADGGKMSLRGAEEAFEAFRKAYPGRKRGRETEWENFRRRNRGKEAETARLLGSGLEREVAWRREAGRRGEFVPEWAHLSTWVNQRRWETEFPEPGNDGKEEGHGRTCVVLD